MFGAICLLACSSALCQEAPTRPERRESADYPPSRVRWTTLAGGLGLTTAFWGMGAGTSYLFEDTSGIKFLRTPVVGPWMALGSASCSGSCEFTHYFNLLWYTLSGLAQAGGLGVALEALLIPTSSSAPSSTPRTRPGVPTAPLQPSEPTEPGPPAGPSDPGGGGPLYFIPVPTFMGANSVGLSWGGMF
jgi:hypothetical protein